MEMKIYKIMSGVLISVMLMGIATVAGGAEPVLRQRPPRKSPMLRVFRDIPVADLVENSPEWVYWKMMLASKAMDFEELAKYQSPAGVWSAKKNTPEVMEVFTAFDLKGSLRIDDSIYDGDACCIYMGFQGSEGGAWQTGYHYFLKKDSRWMSVSPMEWECGKFDSVPGGEGK